MKAKIPKIIHHFWIGKNISSSTMLNVLEFDIILPNYKHYFWTYNIDNNYMLDNFKKRFDIIFEVKDFNKLKYKLPKDVIRTINTLEYNYIASGCNNKDRELQYISDIARYAILYKYGGIYADVDIFPEYDLHDTLYTSNNKYIPLLGPANDYNIESNYKSFNLGISFIATVAKNKIMKESIINANESLKTSNFKSTLGHNDVLKAVMKRYPKLPLNDLSEMLKPEWVDCIFWGY